MIEFRILGPLEVVRDGRSIQLGRQRQRGVLALLVLRAGEVVPADRLIDEFWGGEASESALNALQATVSRLRRQLGGDELLVTRPSGYSLELQPDQLDVWRFDRLVDEGEALLASGDADAASSALRNALAIWRGPALANLGFESFAQPEIARLEEARLAALELRIDADLERGRHTQLVGELEALVGEYPLREGFRGRLMVALYRSGRQADALQAFRDGRALLVDELGIEPSRALQDLERAILSHDVSLEPRAPALKTVGGPPVALEPAVAVATAPASMPSPAPESEDAARPARRSRHRRVLFGACAALAVGLAVALPLALTGGSTTMSLGADTLGRFELGGDRLVRSIPVGARPSAVAFGFGSAWVADAGASTVTRVDDSGAAARDTIQVGSAPAGIAIGAGSVWVANSGSGTVSRVSPATDVVLQTISVGNGPVALTVARGSVWVANSMDGTVSRLSATSGRRLATITVGGTPAAVAAGGAGIWVADEQNGAVDLIDASTGEVIGRTTVGNQPRALAADAKSVWVANTLDGTVSRIDAATGTVRSLTPVESGPIGISLVHGGVWVASGDGMLSRLDPSSGRVVERHRLGTSPSAISRGTGALWLTALASPGDHRGGTLRVAVGTLFAPDPETAFDPDSDRLMSLAYDGLVAYRHVDGAGGQEIAPDLAAAVSQPTGGDTVYTFRLRSGVRFSNGARVTARDVRYSLERSIRVGNPFLGSILGASACTQQRCDLGRGVRVDDRAGTVTIRLGQPDPDLLQALALPISAIVPAGSLLAVGPKHLLPGTGPYRVAAYTPGRRLVFVRNPSFHVFAPDARPDGYPDRIVAVHADGTSLGAVERGRLDWVSLATGEPIGPLLTHFSGQIHIGPIPGLVFPFLNPRVPPFDDLRAREAVNLAVDRAAVARLEGGPLAAQPTCQVLSPGLPGYRPYCPYTRDPGPAGTWVGPDLARARLLVARSGTRGDRVVVWTDAEPFRRVVGSYLVSVLGRLGYRATLRVAPHYFVAIRQGEPQIGWYSWNLDYLSPLNVLAPNFECGAGFNPAGVCSRPLDARIEAAARDAASGSAAAPAEWSRIDRSLVDRAVMLPLVSLRSSVLVSRRVGNVVTNPQFGTLLDQLWVR